MKYIKDADSYDKMFAVSSDKRYRLQQIGRVFSSGKILEEGGWFFDTKTGNDVYVSEQVNGQYVKTYSSDNYDMICPWVSEINGLITKYESSGELLTDVTKMLSSKIFDVKCCDYIKYWLARSTNGDNVEYYFNVESTEQLRKVAEFYSVTYPLDDAYSWWLDNRRMYLRFKSYELISGETMSIIPCGVVWKDGKVVDIKVYIVERPEDRVFMDTDEYVVRIVDSRGSKYDIERATYSEVATVLEKETEVSRYELLTTVEYYDDVLETKVYEGLLADIPDVIPSDVISLNVVYAEGYGSYYKMKYAAYDVNLCGVVPKLPENCRGIRYAVYTDKNCNTPTGKIATIGEVQYRDEKTNNDKVIVYDKRNGVQLTTKGYFYGSNGILRDRY